MGPDGSLSPASGHAISRSGRTLVATLYVCVLVTGVFARLYMIGDQVVMDDEMHSLRAVVTRSPSYIFSHFYEADISIPLTLLQSAIASTLGLNELTARLPGLIGGIAALLLLPFFVRRAFDTEVALLFSALLAISPQLVYHSRYGRPYMLVALLVFTAVYSFHEYWQFQRNSWAGAYVLAAVIAVYFHPLAAPAALSPLPLAVYLTYRSPSDERRARAFSLLAVGAAVIVGIAITLGPPLLTSARELTGHIGRGAHQWRAFSKTLRVFAGADSLLLEIIFWASAGLGVSIALARRPTLTAMILIAIAIQAIVVWALAPSFIGNASTFARYHVCLLPFALVFVALGMTALGRVPWSRPPGNSSSPVLVAGATLVTALVACGPLPIAYRAPNNFTNHPDFQYRFGHMRSLRGSLPHFYRKLAHDTERYAIVEVPWTYQSYGTRYHQYQSIHHKPVFIGFPHSTLRFPSLSEYPLVGPPVFFERFVDIEDFDPSEHRSIRYVIIHKNMRAEMGGRLESGVSVPDVRHLPPLFRSRYGRPIYEDAQIIVFRVDRRQRRIRDSRGPRGRG